MKTSEQVKINQDVAILLLGPPKAGKTTIGLQFPGVWVADADNNLRGAIRALKTTNLYEPFFVTDLNRREDGTEIPIEKRWLNMVSVTNEAIKNKDVKTLFFDGLSSISDYLCEYIVSEKPKEQEKNMTIKDWYPYRQLLTKFIAQLRTSGKIVVMSCHEEVVKDELNPGNNYVRVNIPSKLSDNFGGFFTDVWRVESVVAMGTFLPQIRTIRTAYHSTLGNTFQLPESWKFTKAELHKRLASS